MNRGAEFSDIQPRNLQGNLDIDFVTLPAAAGAAGVDNSVIAPFTQNNVFRMGQQIFFWLGIANPLDANQNFLTRVRLKPWWARPNSEYRQAFALGGTPTGAPGDAQTLPIDRIVFGVGALANPLEDNRYVWMPSPKRLDITPFQTPPPPAAPARNSDSVMLDDIWTVDMPAPTDAVYAAKFVAPQIISRWVPILYPAFGYALGFTYEVETDNAQAPDPPLQVSLSWAQGTFGSGRIQESIG